MCSDVGALAASADVEEGLLGENMVTNVEERVVGKATMVASSVNEKGRACTMEIDLKYLSE